MVNILMSTYNGEKYISTQLDSILGQTYQDFHIYIRDDGSKDFTVDIVEDFAKQRQAAERITVVRGENIGFCASFIELLRTAEEGDYWSFCDQDDYWSPDKIQNAVEYLEKQKKDIPVLFHSAFCFTDENLNVKRAYIPNDPQYDFRKSITCSECYGFASVINRPLREMLVQVDASQIQSHDWFAAMIATAFGKIEFDSRITALHRIHGKNDSPNGFLQKIPRGLKLLREESFYTKNVREFDRLFNAQIKSEEKVYIDLFLNQRKNIKTKFKKFFFHKRWNEHLEVELVLRFLMLLGKI